MKFICLVLLLALGLASGKRDMSSWVPLHDKEFYFNVGTANFEDAEAYCINHGGKLFEPKSSNVNMDITDLAKTRGISDFWIGINDKSQEGTFVYASDATPIIWNNWVDGQPDNVGDQDCAQIGWGPDYTWDDEGCGDLFSFVCERGMC